ncbi:MULTISPECIES: response regulator transcription factor [unclassified Streptomyces]|uniref:response regulator transcription factor n=1 Tax=unclassified Streptomyces TaxID=2593676 RepID=UPI0037FCEF08
MSARILVAEDDTKQAQLVRLYLEHEGHTVTVVHDGRAALEELRRDPPDLLVLDVMMPKVDGLDVCRILRRESDLPVLMLTARCTEDDLLLGLDLGADDYMAKPYSPRELVARVRTLLRRARPAPAAAPRPDPVLTVGGLAVDPVRHEVSCDGEPVDCTPGEFRLLETLAEQPGRVFSREQILAQLHGTGRYFTVRTVDTHVMNLRRKIEPDPARPIRLLTVYGVGYKLAGDA